MNKQSTRILGGAAFAALAGLAAMLAGLERDACWTAAITALCAAWWVTEALPIPATSIVPFAAFPLVGVLSHREAARSYGHYIVLLLLGGFMLSKAVERSGAHRRMALGMVRLVGGFGRRGLVLGFMIATALSSMWISNTATVLMLLPVVQAVLAEERDDDLQVPLLLGIAWAASIGGIGTPIGTPPNAQFIAVYQRTTGVAVSFPEWMSWGVPVVAVLLPIAWWLIARRVRPGPTATLPACGPWRTAEKRVTAVFLLTALLWVLRAAPFGGWQSWLGPWLGGAPTLEVGDDTVALLAVVLLFLIPDGDGGRLLDWDTAAQMPWGLLLLFGGGLAIASAFQESGLSTALGGALEQLASAPAILVLGAITLSVTFLTELTSNTATTALLMPILAAAAAGAGVDPRLLMVPAAMSASCAFMMPVATAPNAIVFGTGRLPIRSMVRHGLRMNLVGALVITVICLALLG